MSSTNFDSKKTQNAEATAISSPSSSWQTAVNGTESPSRKASRNVDTFFEDNLLPLSVRRNMKAASKATSNGVGGGNVDSREALREMLSELRKDAMDDDVMDDNSGAFFPCEFCGDPYPVEYIMRHQLACDLNPTPISEGNGFDYSTIMQRAARNINDTRSAGGI